MRYFEFIGEDLTRKSENAAKFWEVNLVDNTIVVRYGRIGTNGQTKEKNFSTREEAEQEVEKLVKEKTKKGYIEKQMKIEQILEYLASEADEIRDVLTTKQGYETKYFEGALEALEDAINFIESQKQIRIEIWKIEYLNLMKVNPMHVINADH